MGLLAFINPEKCPDCLAFGISCINTPSQNGKRIVNIDGVPSLHLQVNISECDAKTGKTTNEEVAKRLIEENKQLSYTVQPWKK